MTVPTIEELTEGTLDGEGVFDTMMGATRAHIDREWRADRIKAGEYATVYLGGLQVAWQSSLTFLLQKDQAALVQAQVDLAVQQKDLVAQQILQAQKELLIADRQIEKLNREIALADKEILILEVRRNKEEAERQKIVAETVNIPKQGSILDEQRNKIVSEKDLMIQKKKTEAAQTDGTQFNSTSVVGRQTGLYLAQTNGYKSDKLQKAAKLYTDSLGIRLATETGDANANNKMNDDFVGNVLVKLIANLDQ